MTQERFTYLFTKQLNGTCSDLEYQEFNDLLNSGKFDSSAARLMDQHWSESKEVEMDPDTSKSILENIFADANEDQGRKIVFGTSIWISIAAAAVVLVISSVFVFRGVPDFKAIPVNPGINTAKTPSAITAPSAKSFLTTTAHRKVTLPDGSTVVLNNNSTLRMNSDFNAARREVQIVGEGYFDIVHDVNKPFIVTSGKVKTTVLGTAFNVRAYRDSKVEVTVTRGKVSVLAGSNVIGILTPNRKIVVSHRVSTAVISTVIANNAISWQENDLFFDNISFDEATGILSKKFSTPITFRNEKAKQCRFTATFLQGETLDEVLKVICSFNNTNYQHTAAGVTINGSGC
jgi:transmembrane sensor